MIRFVAVAALTCTLGIAVTAASSESARKCRLTTPVQFPDAPDIQIVMDGKPISTDAMKAVPTDTVESVEVVCADVMYRRFGVKTRRGGMIVFTKPGPRARLEAAVDSVRKLQLAYHQRRGVFASRIEELAWKDRDGLIAIELSILDSGLRWQATGTHRWLEGQNAQAVATGKKAPSDSVTF
jgi:hypothetical protein